MNSDFAKFWSAAVFLQHNPLARAAFHVIAENLGISGFGVARKLDKSPVLVHHALASLLEQQLISGSTDLRDNFTLTFTGFGAKEIFHSFRTAPN